MADKRRRGDILYVYDRICTKTSKKNEIISEYGKPESKVKNISYTDGVSFSRRQKNRARAYAEAHPYASSLRNDTSRRAGSRAYGYRPDGAGNGGERVRQKENGRPLKLIIERIINLFDSVEERGAADERIAKQRALSHKRLYDHKNSVITFLIVAAVLVLFAVAVYKIVFVIDSVTTDGQTRYSDGEILSASGIMPGDNLYSFRSDEAEADITFRCPYIKTAEIKRALPRSVSVAVEEDSEMYFANIWGEYVTLSPALRVLGYIERGEARERGLVELVLPAVSYSVSGRPIEFVSARDERFIRGFLGDVNASELFSSGTIDKIDLSDEFALTMQVSGKYLLKLGGESDCDLKLRMAYRTISSLSEENPSPAKIDLSTVGEASVRFDMQLDLEGGSDSGEKQ